MNADKVETLIQKSYEAGRVARLTSVRGTYADLWTLSGALFPQVLVKTLAPLANGSLTAARRAFRCGFNGRPDLR